MSIQQIRNSHQKTSVIVHIDDFLDDQDRQNIQSIVQQVEGVTHAHFNETQNHLMIVGYNPKRTNSGKILTRVLRQHLHARLI
jgi:hypothetical protein